MYQSKLDLTQPYAFKVTGMAFFAFPIDGLFGMRMGGFLQMPIGGLVDANMQNGFAKVN